MSSTAARKVVRSYTLLYISIYACLLRDVLEPNQPLSVHKQPTTAAVTHSHPARSPSAAGSAASAPTRCTAPRSAATARAFAWTWTSATPSRAGRRAPSYQATMCCCLDTIMVKFCHCCVSPRYGRVQSGSAAAECLNTLGAYSCGACPAGFKQELGVDQGHGCIPVGGAAGH